MKRQFNKVVFLQNIFFCSWLEIAEGLLYALPTELWRYLVAQLFHDLDVERLETVTVWIYEVEAAMDAVVHNVLPVETAFVTEIPEITITRLKSGLTG